MNIMEVSMQGYYCLNELGGTTQPYILQEDKKGLYPLGPLDDG